MTDTDNPYSFETNFNYLRPTPGVLRVILASYAKAGAIERAELEARNPDVDFKNGCLK